MRAMRCGRAVRNPGSPIVAALISRQSVAALQHRNFRLIWLGLFVSFTGTMMQNAALVWHVSLLVAPEHKGVALGTVGLIRFAPIVVFSIVSGVVADAWDCRKVMLVTQNAAALVALGLASVAFFEVANVPLIYGLAAVAATVSVFDVPARNALVPTLVPRERLANAISLNTIMFQAASVIGPSIAGVLIAATNIGWAYLANAASFGWVIVALLLMRDVPERQPSAPGARDDVSVHAALEGLRFVFRSPLIRSTMLLDFFAKFFSSAMALLPIFAQDILHVGAGQYGWLYAAPSAGAVVASAAMVSLTERITRRGAALCWSVAGYGLATIAFGVSRSFWLTCLCLAITGAADTVSMIIRNVIRQLETPDRLRGRMTGVNMVFFMGGPQLGEFEAGLVAHWFGATVSVVSGGLACLVVTGWIATTTGRSFEAARRNG